MADNTPTTVARKVSGKTTNARELTFPFDQHGFTTIVRKEGARAVGRIKGDKDKLRVFLETLKVLGEHAKAKMAAHEAEVKAHEEAAAARVVEEAARKRKDAELELKRVEDMARATLATRRRLKTELAEGAE